jgi:hypothetical protein
LPVCCC